MQDTMYRGFVGAASIKRKTGCHILTHFRTGWRETGWCASEKKSITHSDFSAPTAESEWEKKKKEE